jgi:hypothetical protein
MTLAKAPWLHPDCNRNFFATMGLSDATTRPVPRLWLLLSGCSELAAERLCRASQVPVGSVCARCLLSPRRVQPVHLVETSGLMLASTLLKGWPLSVKFNEADSSSRDTTARAFASSGFDRQDCSRRPQSWLHDFRPSIMMNTLHFTRTTELSWRTRRKQSERRTLAAVWLDLRS